MNWLKTIGREGSGLFVEDGSLAAGIVVWLGLAWIGRSHLPLPESWQGPVLFVGLALILIENTLRRARS